MGFHWKTALLQVCFPKVQNQTCQQIESIHQSLMVKYNKILYIVRIRQMLRAWRRKATSSRHNHQQSPPDVPGGHVALCVGSNSRRFIVRATHLNHPVFRQLLSRVAEEYGFSNTRGALEIPCDESLFEEILLHVSRGTDFERCGHVCDAPDCLIESRPLLYRFGSLDQFESPGCFWFNNLYFFFLLPWLFFLFLLKKI